MFGIIEVDLKFGSQDIGILIRNQIGIKIFDHAANIRLFWSIHEGFQKFKAFTPWNLKSSAKEHAEHASHKASIVKKLCV